MTDLILVFLRHKNCICAGHALFSLSVWFFRSETDDFSLSDRQAKIMPKKLKLDQYKWINGNPLIL